METIGDEALIERMNREAGAKLLDRIGPAVLLGHLQAGPLLSAIADERPTPVKGILVIEPSGPPIRNNDAKGPPNYFADGELARPWGIARGPMTYNPAVASPEDLKLTRQDQSEGPGLVRCFMQVNPATS